MVIKKVSSVFFYSCLAMQTSEQGVNPTCKKKYLSEAINSNKQAVPKESALP